MSIEEKQWLELSDGEDIIWWNHPSLVHYGSGLISSVFIMISGIVVYFKDIPYVQEGLYPLLLIPLGFVFLFGILYKRSKHYYVATTQKVVEKTGIVARNRDPVHYSRMQNTMTDESKTERILSLLPGVDLGDIVIATAATDRAELILYDVPNVNKVSQVIADQMRANSVPPEMHQGNPGQAEGHDEADGSPQAGGQHRSQAGGQRYPDQ